jgi:WD40 repeat protein
VLVVGGLNLDSDKGSLATAELYDPTSGKWSPTGSMGFNRSDFTATLLANGRVLVAGGGSNSAELYDPATGKFSPTGHMVMPREMQSAALLPDGRVLIAGGNDDTQAELYWP